MERYYHDLLAQERNASESMDGDNFSGAARKWKRQIEKVNRCMRLGLYCFNS